MFLAAQVVLAAATSQSYVVGRLGNEVRASTAGVNVPGAGFLVNTGFPGDDPGSQGTNWVPRGRRCLCLLRVLP